jgi:peptidyl-tRNA hydrolase
MATRVEKLSPPLVEDIWAAAGLSVISLLDDERSQPDGSWHEAVEQWSGARIRKLMRRARGANWARAQELEGVTVKVGSAEVRAFLPGPMAAAPPDLAKLQIQSSPLDLPETISSVPENLTGSNTLIVLLTPAVEMSWGKAAAQCAHAAQRTWEAAAAERRQAWDGASRPIKVFLADEALWDRSRDGAEAKIHDGGYTEIPAGTLTALGFWA